jgi:hypothetical protein
MDAPFDSESNSGGDSDWYRGCPFCSSPALVLAPFWIEPTDSIGGHTLEAQFPWLRGAV